MKRYLRSKVVGFSALLVAALAVFAATAAPALGKPSMIPGTHLSTSAGILYVVAALGALSVVLLAMTVVGARRQRRVAQAVSVEAAQPAQMPSAPADRPARRKAA
jgi:hypothetical protein